jgi:predicted transcriptional regulator
LGGIREKLVPSISLSPWLAHSLFPPELSFVLCRVGQFGGSKMEYRLKDGKNLMRPGCPEESHTLAERLKILDEECGKCSPVTPLVCISSCRLWKQKHEFRRLRELMDTPDFMNGLLNALKSDARLFILRAIGRGIHSLKNLQLELKKTGYVRSQKSIIKEVLNPLQKTDLVYEAQGQYYSTEFGGRIIELTTDSKGILSLSRQSRCYEENILRLLESGPQTIEQMTSILSNSIVSRELSGLRKRNLVKASAERSYVFFFKSKGIRTENNFDSNENKVYDCLSEWGISVGKLAEKTDLSAKAIYICLRRLRGKKLVFKRKTPKVYFLTVEGEKLTKILSDLYHFVEETSGFLVQANV